MRTCWDSQRLKCAGQTDSVAGAAGFETLHSECPSAFAEAPAAHWAVDFFLGAHLD